MAEFVPEEDIFPSESIAERVLDDSVAAQLVEFAADLLPTPFETLRVRINSYLDQGISIPQLDDAVLQLTVLQDAIQLYPFDSASLYRDLWRCVSKPILEKKANERLTEYGMESIERFYFAIAQLLPCLPVEKKVDLLRSFRFICHGGKDPNHNEDSNQESSTRDSIVDIGYNMARLSKSGALSIIVDEFKAAVQLLDYNKNTNGSLQELSSSFNNQQTVVDEEDLTLYGLPPPKNNQQVVDNDNDMTMASPTSPQQPQQQPHSTKDSKAVLRELTQSFLDLCLDMTAAAAADQQDAAVLLTELGLCEACVTLLEKDFAYDHRDYRLSLTVELMWNGLESFAAAKLKSTSSASSQSSLHAELLLLIRHHCLMDLERAVTVLFRLLDFQLLQGYRQADKEFRNMIMIVLQLMADFPVDTMIVSFFLQSNLLPWLVTYACVEEVGHDQWLFFVKPVANKRNFATVADVDLEFKKQLWMLLTSLFRSRDSDCLLLLAASPLLSCLLSYLEAEVKVDAIASAAASAIRHSRGGRGGGGGQGSALIGQGQGLLQSSWVDSTMGGFSPAASHSYGDHHHHHVPQAIASRSLMTSNLLFGGTRNNNNNNNNNNNLSKSSSSKNNSMMKTIAAKEKSFMESLSASKMREFQVQAALFLVQNAPMVLAEFERLDGPSRIMAIASSHCQSEQAEDKLLTFNCLLLLQRCLTNSLSVRAWMEDGQAINSCLAIFNASRDEESRAMAVRLISSLCGDGDHRSFCQEQLRSFQGVKALLEPLRSYVLKRPAMIGLKAAINIHHNRSDHSDPLPDPLDNAIGGEISVLVIAIVDCLGQGIVGHVGNELHLAELEGVDTLLDLMEISLFVLRLQVMRVLADLLVNDRLVPFANCWRSSKTLRSAALVFTHAWLDEEARLDSEQKAKDSHGIIVDLLHPLGKQAWPVSEQEKPLIGIHNDGFRNTFSQSVTVTKLATAILAGRSAVRTNLPVDICSRAMSSDARSILADAMESLGLFEAYGIGGDTSPFKPQPDEENEDDERGLLEDIIGEDDDNAGAVNHTIDDPGFSSASIVLPVAANEDHSNSSNDGNQQQSQPLQFTSQSQQSRRTPGIDQRHHHHDKHNNHSPSISRAIANANSNNDGDNNINGGFDEIRLGPREKQVLAIARKYSSLREGDWWQEIRDHLQQKKVTAIDSDQALIDNRLEHAFDAALALQTEQMALYEEQEEDKQQQESLFLGQILTKKRQQIKAEWLKRIAKGGTKKKITKAVPRTELKSE